jgi:hypothetical protein
MAARKLTRPRSKSLRRLRIQIVQSEMIYRLQSYRDPQFETAISRKVLSFPEGLKRGA